GSLEKDPSCFPIGYLTRDDKVQVYLRMEDLLKTHFGVFGFTGVGKSNLISTIISKLLNKAESNIKIVLFDLMDEYTGLLLDLLMDQNLDANIIYYGEKSLPGPVIEYINNKTISDKKNAKSPATRLFLKNLLLPKGLRSKIGTFINPVEKLLDSGRIKIMAPEDVTVQEFLSEIWEERIMKGSRSRNIQNSMEDIKEKIVGKYGRQMLTKETAKEIMDSIIFEDPALDRNLQKKNDLTQKNHLDKIVYSNKYLNSYINNIKSEFRRATSKSEIVLIDDLKMTKRQFIDKLQQKKKGLYIITSYDQDQIRRLSKEMGDYLYEERRKKGIIEPNVVFVFDEADEFIPQTPSRDSQKESKKIIETLTRRGRKFGIGVGIATQRSSYLDTNIMGQLHTYFISKLPREYDRKVVGDAFSLSENEFIQTFKFSKGQWLLVSHDALGIDSVALPIKTENAEDRIVRNLELIK
ncbi:MAG: ATP-binding protein, partial [Candidatus Methanofastidiosum sp.]|nr:ATP-binding protein [Methanofastidiosum sp.]